MKARFAGLLINRKLKKNIEERQETYCRKQFLHLLIVTAETHKNLCEHPACGYTGSTGHEEVVLPTNMLVTCSGEILGSNLGQYRSYPAAFCCLPGPLG
jgi:hypothetical protein